MTNLFNFILGLTIVFICYELMGYFGLSQFINGWISSYVFAIAIQPYLKGVRRDKKIREGKENKDKFRSESTKRN